MQLKRNAVTFGLSSLEAALAVAKALRPNKQQQKTKPGGGPFVYMILNEDGAFKGIYTWLW